MTTSRKIFSHCCLSLDLDSFCVNFFTLMTDTARNLELVKKGSEILEIFFPSVSPCHSLCGNGGEYSNLSALMNVNMCHAISSCLKCDDERRIWRVRIASFYFILHGFLLTLAQILSVFYSMLPAAFDTLFKFTMVKNELNLLRICDSQSSMCRILIIELLTVNLIQYSRVCSTHIWYHTTAGASVCCLCVLLTLWYAAMMFELLTRIFHSPGKHQILHKKRFRLSSRECRAITVSYSHKAHSDWWARFYGKIFAMNLTTNKAYIRRAMTLERATFPVIPRIFNSHPLWSDSGGDLIQHLRDSGFNL